MDKNIDEKGVMHENIYQKMIEELADYAIILLDADGIIKSWNTGAERIKGYKAEEVIGKNFKMFYRKEDRDKGIPEQTIREAKQKGKYLHEGWRETKAGSFIWVNSVLTTLFDNDNKTIIGFTKVVRDLTEQKMAEEQTEFLANIVRNIHDPIISTDLNRLITDWNEAAEDLLGWKKEEVIGKNIREILKTELFVSGKKGLEKILKEKGVWRGEMIVYSKKGASIHTHLTCSYIKKSDQTITGVVTLIRDITERKNAEQVLEKLNNKLELKVKQRTEEIFERDRRFQSLIENDYTITALVDENYESIYRSPSAETILGWSEEERDTMPINAIYHPDELTLQKNTWSEILKKPGVPINTTFRLKHKKGHYVWVECIAVNRLNDPYVKAVVINMHDINERKNSEDFIRKSEENYRLLIERISDGFIALDNEFRYTFVNKKIGEMTGKAPAYLIGKNVWEVFPDAVGSQTYKAFQTALKEQRYIYNVDYYEELNLWQENHIYPSADGLSIFIRDISERKKAELVIKQLNESLEERVKQRTSELLTANKALESFSYMVSHDLQSPLRSLNGFTNIIVEKYSHSFDQELKGLFNYILTSGRRMNAIIDDLLKLAKFGSNTLTMSSVNMSDLFEKVWDNLTKNTLSKAQLELLPLPAIQGDASTLEQVVINLLSNAIKYSSKVKEPKIKVGYSNKNGDATFFVTDNGVGFSMEHYNKLFGAFQRLHAATDFEGTGIGLLLVKRIIENHGGTVWAESKENQGATFYFTIPQKKE